MELVNGKPSEPNPWNETQSDCPRCGQRLDVGPLLEGYLNQGLDALDEVPEQVWWAIGIYGFVWPLIKWVFLLVIVPTLVVLAFHFLGI